MRSGLDKVSIQLNPEDGRLSVLGLGDEATTAFSPFGVENLAELVQIHKADPVLLPRRPLSRAKELAALLPDANV